MPNGKGSFAGKVAFVTGAANASAAARPMPSQRSIGRPTLRIVT
jgi:hypothetical protein